MYIFLQIIQKDLKAAIFVQDQHVVDELGSDRTNDSPTLIDHSFGKMYRRPNEKIAFPNVETEVRGKQEACDDEEHRDQVAERSLQCGGLNGRTHVDHLNVNGRENYLKKNHIDVHIR